MIISREDTYDFIVCGGGMSGFAAAVSAARKGLSVAIVERTGCLGGTATSAGVNHLLGGRKINGETNEHVRVVGGLFDELTDYLIERGEAIEPNSIDLSFNAFGWYPRMASGIAFDELALKIALDNFCAECGVRVYFNTMLVDAEVSDSRLKAVIVHNKDGFVRLTADAFSDCTGDADLSTMSGCEVLKGRKEDGCMTPCSLEMHVENIDVKELVTYQNVNQSPKLVEIIERLKQEGIWKFPYEIFVAVRLVEEDVFMVNTIRQIMVDGTNEASVSKALAQGRRENLELFQIMKEHFPGFKNARIRKICDYLGVRETRRLGGRYVITVDDAMSGKKFDDCIAATTYNFDLPDPLRPSYDPMMGDAKRPNANRNHVVIRIPYRALLPQEVDNLIVAGRCISAEREVLGAIRVMGPCMMMGQVAGTAAVIAIKENEGCFSKISVAKLQDQLWNDGVKNPDNLPFD